MPPSLRRERLRSSSPPYVPPAHTRFLSRVDLLQSACSCWTEELSGRYSPGSPNLALPGRWQGRASGGQQTCCVWGRFRLVALEAFRGADNNDNMEGGCGEISIELMGRVLFFSALVTQIHAITDAVRVFFWCESVNTAALSTCLFERPDMTTLSKLGYADTTL